MAENAEYLFDRLVYSCAFEKHRGLEQFIPEHFLGFQVSGETHAFREGKSLIIRENSLILVRRNQLIRTVKHPSSSGKYQFLSVILDQESLKQYALDSRIPAGGAYSGDGLLSLKSNPYFRSYFQSLMPYAEEAASGTSRLGNLKIREAIELILREGSVKGPFLFDFAEPHKLDIRQFMEKNYMFNVPTTYLARLTGRSLSAFKRDFSAVFESSPRNWLLNRRLEEAFYLIKHEQKRPADIYLDLGFENLSHFYFTFKQKYGTTTSEI